MAPTEPVKLLRVRKLGVGRTVIDADGLAVRDEDGAERIALMLDGSGAELALTRGGDDAAVVSAYSDADQPFYPGAIVSLCDGEGDPVVAWHVELKGAVNRLVGDERQRTCRYQALGGEVTVHSRKGAGLSEWALHGRFGEPGQ